MTDRSDPVGNERLTAIVGTVLLVLFAAEVVTTLADGQPHIPKLPALLASDPAERALRAASSSRARWLLLAGSLIGGLILALLTYHLRARRGSWGGNIL